MVEHIFQSRYAAAGDGGVTCVPMASAATRASPQAMIQRRAAAFFTVGWVIVRGGNAIPLDFVRNEDIIPLDFFQNEAIIPLDFIRIGW